MQNQRQLFVPLATALFAGAIFCTGALKADETIDLKIQFPAGQQVRVVASFEHTGNVIVDSEQSAEQPEQTQQRTKKVTLLPLKVDAKLTYFHRTMTAQQAVRYYEKASAKITLDKGSTQPEIADTNRLVIARLKTSTGKNVEMASIANTLTQEELELLQHAADPLTIGELINRSQVKTGQQWEPDLDDLAKFLGVQKIGRSDVKLQLKKFNDSSARIFITGSVNASVDDVETELELSGIINVDREQNMVSSLKIGIRETKRLGQIAPGFEGMSKIELRISSTEGTPKLSNEALAELTNNRKIRQRVKWNSTDGQFELKFEPHWKMIAEEQDAAILRYLKNGTITAQCNIVLLPPRPANSPISLENYKKEIAKIVAKDDQARLIDATESQTDSELRKVRVVVASAEDGLPINWVYYHIASKDGRQITFVFTMAESVFIRMNPVAEQLVNEFVFNDLSKHVASNQDELGPEDTASDKLLQSRKR